MKKRVVIKQHNSKKCFVCGLENEFGLKASFYELDNQELAALYKPIADHQGYPGRLHGGIAAAILDETIGRAIMINDENTWGVTVELNLKYKKPIPLDEDLRVVARIIKDSSRIFEGAGEILLKNGDVAASAHGRYFKLPIDKIGDFNEQDLAWQVILSGNEPTEIDL